MALSLVIDDEQVVCDMLSTILARYGYEVETAEDGAAALALFAARREKIGLVLLDPVDAQNVWRRSAGPDQGIGAGDPGGVNDGFRRPCRGRCGG